MAKYEHLPIYKSAYELLELTAIKTKDFPVNFKGTIGFKLTEETFNLVLYIYKANQTKEKIPFITNAIETIEMIELLLRLSKDLKLINIESHVKFIEITDSLLKQSNGWLRQQKSIGSNIDCQGD